MIAFRRHNILPGFGVSLGYTLIYLGIMVFVPLLGLYFRASGMNWSWFCETTTNSRVLSAYRLSFTASFAAAFINLLFGSLVAWVLVRYDFPGRRLMDSTIDILSALPTAVAGITLTSLYTSKGWIGCCLNRAGLQAVFSPLGIIIALTFISLPFAVRVLQAALKDLDPALEDAAVCLGANRWQTIIRVTLPTVLPALITGFSLAFARALGEYGSVVFISGNMPMKTEVAPLLMAIKLEQYDVAGATAIAAVMMGVSFFILLTINVVQWWRMRECNSF
ncbi:MAG: sulfate ABC transporter permease subunit CysT [Elusimicrobia bacterium]|nr:sulfate ABC transporter permease subunit CysT [Candidatus Obscuribacterium magneticum]